ncbi:MAG: long-chain fatty acid--CoA ligase [Gemmatimonadota bacterium]
MIGEVEAFQELESRILPLLERGVDGPLSDEEFNDLALRVFRFQCRWVAAYGAFVARRGLDPEGASRWEEIPHLPTRAFKAVPLMAGDPREAQAVFRTSGTTGGEGVRGEHYVRSLSLYRASLLPNFQAHVFPDGECLPALALLPDPAEAPESSLSYMLGEVRRDLSGGRGGFFMDPDSGLRTGEFLRALREAEEADDPVLLAGTAFAFVHWMEEAENEGWKVRLPEGSRIMETGGFKGRSRTVPREALYSGLEDLFGVPRTLIVNEYGMTELLSQFYEPVLAGGRGWGGRAEGEGWSKDRNEEAEPPWGALSRRYHRGPPWVRTRILHPLTLEPVPAGEVGILAHLDLANLGSISAVLTEDTGRLVPGGFRLQGRSPGAEPRGCSLAMEDFLHGARGGRGAI